MNPAVPPAGPPPGDGPAADEQDRAVHFSVVFDANNAALGLTVEPPDYPLSQLISALPPAAQQVLGWVPDISVKVVGFIVNPLGRVAGLYCAAGDPRSAKPSATLFIADVPVDRALGMLVGLALDSPIDLGGTPLFGSMLEGLSIDALAVTWASADIPAGRVVLPPPAAPSSEQPAYGAGPGLGLTLRDGENREYLRLRPPGRKNAGADFARRPAGPGADAGADPPEPPQLPIVWFPVEKRLGPLTVGRVGVLGTQTAFGLALDATVRTTALSIGLTGFTVVFDPRSDITPSAVRVALDGLAVAFGSGRLSIQGGLVRTVEQTDDGPVTAYNGSLAIQAGPYGIAAVGSFAQYRGSPSLFVFGVALGRFGGVPAFFVTGLAAGFGYHRRLRLPAVDQVLAFPLVRVARSGPLGARASLPAADQDAPPTEDGDASADGDGAALLLRGDAASALAELSSGGWVPIASGAYWVAAGVAFTSFGVLDGFAMLVVMFGERFAIALLGVVGLRLPKAGRGVVYVELAIDALFDPVEGIFRVDALLTPNSYLFHPDARLSGGFALRVWFAGPHAGDVVATIGGYHPAFDRPEWYPQVPRLAFAWNVSDQLSIAGSAYIAITPSAAMAGGNLALHFQAGGLAAWLTAHADILVNWRPVFFDIDISVSVGVSYTLRLGTIHRTLTAELGAALTLWGPPFTGTARVRWAVFSFTVAINGGRRPDLPGPVIDWAEFQTAFLPVGPDDAPDASGVCRPRAAAGLLDEVELGGRATWLVDAAALVLATETAIPASLAVVLGPGGPTDSFTSPRVGLYPLGSMTVETVHQLQVKAVIDGVPAPRPLDLGGWSWSAVPGQVPYAVWGTQNTGRAELGAELLPAVTGVHGVPPTVQPPGPPPVALGLLEDSEVLPRREFRLSSAPIDGSTPRPSLDPRVIVADTLAQPTVVAARAAVVDLLTVSGLTAGVTGGRLNVLAGRVSDVFTSAPMLGAPGSTGPRPPTQVTPAVRASVRASVPEPASVPVTSGAPDTRTPARRARLRAVFYTSRLDPGHRPQQDPWAWAPAGPRAAEAHVIDALAAPADAMIAARHQRAGGSGAAAMRLDPGASLLWDLPEADPPREAGSDGALPVRLRAFDAQHHLALDAFLPAGDATSVALPQGCRLLLLSALAPTGAVWGWSADTPLLLLAPQALVAGRVVVRPQAPLRLPDGPDRPTRAVGVLSGRDLVRANRIGSLERVRPGWIDTLFPAAADRIHVTVRASGPAAHSDDLHGGADGAVPVRVTAHPGEPAAGRPGTPLAPRAVHAAHDLLRVTYRAPVAAPRPGSPLRIRVAPEPGWIIESVLGAPIDHRRAGSAHLAGGASGTATVVLR